MIGKITNKFLFDKTIIYILLCAFLIFIGKWFFSFYYFNDSLDLKIILDTPSDGYFYYPYVKALSELNFNNSFDFNIVNLNNISFPFYAILIHSILLPILGDWTFVILELVSIFIFLIIFYFIFQGFDFSKVLSITLSLIIFSTPSLINFLNFNFIPYISNLMSFYTLRFPIPLVSSLFFFSFFLFLIYLNGKEIFKIKYFIILAILLSFSFTSFYYFFVIEAISFVLFLLYKYKFNINNLLKNKIKYYLISLVTLIILSLPFLLNLYLAEPDYNERTGIINLTLERKIILMDHLFKKIIKIEFLIISILILTLTYIANNKKINNYQLNIIFFIIFLGSVLSPFIFIILSPKSGLAYHFTNTIFYCAFLCLFFLAINLIKFYLNNNFSNKNFDKYFILGIILIIFLYNFKIYYNYKLKYLDENYSNNRNDLNLITQKIKKSKLENNGLRLLTFDANLMVWAIMNGINHINPLSGQLVPKTHKMIENDLISNFKFLNLKEKDFIEFFKNKKSNWRYYNRQTQLFFWMRYSANSLKTHNDSQEFDKDMLKFILNTSPLHAQSFAIPGNEFERLKLRFKNFNTDNFDKPNIIILNKENYILSKAKIDRDDYCVIPTNKNMKLYILKSQSEKCSEK